VAAARAFIKRDGHVRCAILSALKGNHGLTKGVVFYRFMLVKARGR